MHLPLMMMIMMMTIIIVMMMIHICMHEPMMMIIINILACNAVEGDLQGARRGSGHPVAIQIR